MCVVTKKSTKPVLKRSKKRVKGMSRHIEGSEVHFKLLLSLKKNLLSDFSLRL